MQKLEQHQRRSSMQRAGGLAHESVSNATKGFGCGSALTSAVDPVYLSSRAAWSRRTQRLATRRNPAPAGPLRRRGRKPVASQSVAPSNSFLGGASRAAASRSIVANRGSRVPRSMRETSSEVISAASASWAWVKPRWVRSAFTWAPRDKASEGTGFITSTRKQAPELEAKALAGLDLLGLQYGRTSAPRGGTCAEHGWVGRLRVLRRGRRSQNPTRQQNPMSQTRPGSASQEKIVHVG